MNMQDFEEYVGLTEATHSISLDESLDKWDELFEAVDELFKEHSFSQI